MTSATPPRATEPPSRFGQHARMNDMNLLYWIRRGRISFGAPDDTTAARVRTAQGGQALVLFALFFTVILGTAALVLDQGMLRKANMDLANALDSGALAGVALLPGDPVGAERLAREYVQLNFPGALPDADVNVGFRCLIGTQGNHPRLTDVPLTCDPGPSATWTIEGEIAYTSCDPNQAHVCNVIVLSGPATVDYKFGPAIGVNSGSTGARTAAACKGICGEPPKVPVDIVMILDRTASMSGVDTANMQLAAQDVRQSLDPAIQWIGLSFLHRSKTKGNCYSKPDNSNNWTANAPADLRTWVPYGLTGTGAAFDTDYSANGSRFKVAIDCLDNSSGQGTDLADPVRMATYELEKNGRPQATKAIILLSDGQPTNSADPNVRRFSDYCQESYAAAQAAKAKGIEVYAVGFGLDGANDALCGDKTSLWKGKKATDLLAAMATNSSNDGCPANENDDGDHFFCLPKTPGRSPDLSYAFQRAVTQLTSYSRLVSIDD